MLYYQKNNDSKEVYKIRIRKSSFDSIPLDKELFKLFPNANAENNENIIRLAKRALREIIKEELSQRQKQFIVLYYYEQNTMTEIAEICGVNVSTVSRTISRAKRNIYSRIKYYFV